MKLHAVFKYAILKYNVICSIIFEYTYIYLLSCTDVTHSDISLLLFGASSQKASTPSPGTPVAMDTLAELAEVTSHPAGDVTSHTQ